MVKTPKMVVKRKLNRSRSSSMDAKLPMKKKKRVSFANTLEVKSQFDSANAKEEFNSSSSAPGGGEEEKPKKGILKIKRERDATKIAKSDQKFPNNNDEGTPNERNKFKKDSRNRKAQKPFEMRKKRTLVVKRSTKEMLMTMSKKERKQFIMQLAEKNKPNFQLVKEAKQLWETIRSKKAPKEAKEECVQKMLGLFRGKLKELVISPATSRVIQSLFALKSTQVRQFVFDELKTEVLAMTKSKYAKFFVSKMLKYGSKEQRDEVINALRGHYVRLLQKLHSAELVDAIFREWATAQQHHAIAAEFYGPEYALFQNDFFGQSHPNIWKIAQDSPEKIPSILKNLESVLEGISQKIPILKLSITHRLLLDYLNHCSDEQRRSMIDNLKDHLPEICHTRDGSRAALLCIWHASAKERKAMVRSFKGLAVKSAQDEFGRRVLFGIFDAVDDTTLVNKFITAELGNNIGDVVYHKYAVWVLHYLVHPRDYRVIGKGLYEILKQGDGNAHSKKDSRQRYTDLFECVRPALLDFMKANMREMIGNKVSAVLILDTLEPTAPTDPFKREIPVEDLRECFRAIADVAGDEFVPHSLDGPRHIVQGGCARFVFRKLLQLDPQRGEGDKLSDFLADLPPEALASWTGMDCGCYALVEMLKSGSKGAKKALEKALNRNGLKKSSLAGSKALQLELFGEDAT